MAAEGLWTVQFSKSEEDHGGLLIEEQLNRGGIFVLTGNRLYGGGLSYYFVGTYQGTDSDMSITVNATKYNDIVTGPFGPVGEARLIFKGSIKNNTMSLQGHLEDDPNKRIFITAERKTELL